MGLTTDPNDPRLSHYTGPEEPHPQGEVYLILSDEERKKGFVRPIRESYTHIGPAGPEYPLSDLTPEQLEWYGNAGYSNYEKYPEGGRTLGRYWTQQQLEAVGAGCGISTRMAVELCETYARNPQFYGATYCVGCSAHFPVKHFVWDDDGTRVGS